MTITPSAQVDQVRSDKSDIPIRSKFKQIVSIKLSLCKKLNTVKKPGIFVMIKGPDTNRQCLRASTGRVHNLMKVMKYSQEASVMLGLRREQFIACTRSVARGHVEGGEWGKAES
jgi:hypothetical protein